MKKLISACMLLVLVLCTSLSALAANNNTTVDDLDADKPSIDVNATLANSPDEQEVISVAIVWTDMTFTYTQKQDKVWNPEKHDYDVTDKDEGSGWNKTQATVTVTNHSNKTVNVSLNYTPVANCGVSGSFDSAAKDLASGVGRTVSEADKWTATLTISGKPAQDGTNKVGTVTVQIVKK